MNPQHPFVRMFRTLPVGALFLLGMLVFAVLSGGIAVIISPEPSVLVTVTSTSPAEEDGNEYVTATTRDGTHVLLLGDWAPRQTVNAYPLNDAGEGNPYVEGEPPSAMERFWTWSLVGAVLFSLLVGIASMHYLANTRKQSNQPWADANE